MRKKRLVYVDEKDERIRYKKDENNPENNNAIMERENSDGIG